MVYDVPQDGRIASTAGPVKLTSNNEMSRRIKVPFRPLRLPAILGHSSESHALILKLMYSSLHIICTQKHIGKKWDISSGITPGDLGNLKINTNVGLTETNERKADVHIHT
jgi:hypothetical protein